MKRHSWFYALVIAIALPAAPLPLSADTAGEPGRIIALTYNSSGSDERGLFWGAVVIKPWQGSAQEYRWGGSSCPGKNLDVDETALLERALLSWRVKTRPFYKFGQGGFLCLVGFELSR